LSVLKSVLQFRTLPKINCIVRIFIETMISAFVSMTVHAKFISYFRVRNYSAVYFVKS
jgi:hypothetical protein